MEDLEANVAPKILEPVEAPPEEMMYSDKLFAQANTKCLICGEGIDSGKNCDKCWNFFTKASKQAHKKLVCKDYEDCDLSVERKCRFCRYQRCQEVGLGKFLALQLRRPRQIVLKEKIRGKKQK